MIKYQIICLKYRFYMDIICVLQYPIFWWFLAGNPNPVT